MTDRPLGGDAGTDQDHGTNEPLGAPSQGVSGESRDRGVSSLLPSSERRSVGPRYVLVVDDSPDMRSVIEDVLRERGYEVVGAASGGRALGLMGERAPDLVITDLFMPGMNGFTLRGEMLRRPALTHIPVIVLSAFWQRPSETLDVVEVLPKPLNIDRLVEAVARALPPDGSDDAGSGTPPAPEQGQADQSILAADGEGTQGRKHHAGGFQPEA